MIGQVFGSLKPTVPDAEKRAADLVRFESKLAAITPSAGDQGTIAVGAPGSCHQGAASLMGI